MLKNECLFFFKQLIDFHLFFFIACFIVVLPASHSPAIFSTFDDQRFYQLLLLAIVLVCLNFSSYKASLFSVWYCFPLQARYASLGVLILSIFSALKAPLPNYAFLEISLYCSLFLFCVTISGLYFKNHKIFHPLIFVISISSGVVYQVCFFAGFSASFIENLPLKWPEPFTGFSNIRMFNQYQLWIFFLISAPLILYPSLRLSIKNFISFFATGWAVLLFASSTRGGTLAIGLSLIIAWFIFRQQAIPFIKLNCQILFLGLLGYLVLFQLLPFLLGREVILGWHTLEQLTTDMPRLYLWHLALTYVQQHPWLGIGPMHYAYYPNLIAMHPHNSLLQWAAEFGLPSALIVLGLIIWGIVAWIKRHKVIVTTKNHEKIQLSLILLTTLIANLGYSMVDGVIVMPVSQVLMAIIAGWMFGFYFEDKKNTEISDKENIGIMIFSGIILATLVYTAVPGFIKRMDIDYEDTSYENMWRLLMPRFWQEGRISD